MTFGQRVREYRKALGITQRDLAESVTAMALEPDQRLDWIDLSKIENDRLPPPSYPVICHLVVALSPTTDQNPFEIFETLLDLSEKPFVMAPKIDTLHAIICGCDDDLETWQEKLNSWQAMATP